MRRLLPLSCCIVQGCGVGISFWCCHCVAFPPRLAFAGELAPRRHNESFRLGAGRGEASRDHDALPGCLCAMFPVALVFPEQHRRVN